jgi:hypothetical protein
MGYAKWRQARHSRDTMWGTAITLSSLRVAQVAVRPAFPGAYDGRATRSALVPRSDHLGHTQVCDCQFEVALVEYLCVCFLAARCSDPVQLVLVPL